MMVVNALKKLASGIITPRTGGCNLLLIGLLVIFNTFSITTLYADEQADVTEKNLAALMLNDKKQRAENENNSPEARGLQHGKTNNLTRARLIKAQHNYDIANYVHREKVFAWQLLSSKIIFTIVILLVCIGLYFSWIQFRVDLKKADKESSDAAPVTTLEASSSGLTVSSPVLGVIILVLSLAFFYLYLVYVYPIEVIT